MDTCVMRSTCPCPEPSFNQLLTARASVLRSFTTLMLSKCMPALLIYLSRPTEHELSSLYTTHTCAAVDSVQENSLMLIIITTPKCCKERPGKSCSSQAKSWSLNHFSLAHVEGRHYEPALPTVSCWKKASAYAMPKKDCVECRCGNRRINLKKGPSAKRGHSA